MSGKSSRIEQRRKGKETRRQKKKEKEKKRARQIIHSHNVLAPEPSFIPITLDSESDSESKNPSSSSMPQLIDISKSHAKRASRKIKEIDALEDSKALKLLEDLGKHRVTKEAVDIHNSNSNVIESALRPIKDVSTDLLQVSTHPIAFRARLRYVQDEIIPLGLPVCVPIHFFIMTGRITKEQLGKMIKYPKFKCKGMNGPEIGKLFESYGYKHTNPEYKEEYEIGSAILDRIEAYSGRYYMEKDSGLFVDQIKSTLRVNHATPVSFHRKSGFGHAACIANLNGDVFLVDANIGEIPIEQLPIYMKLGGALTQGVYPKFDSVQIYYGASLEESDIVLPPKREVSGKVVGIGSAMSQKEAPPRIRKLKEGVEPPRKRIRTEGGRNYTRRRLKGTASLREARLLKRYDS